MLASRMKRKDRTLSASAPSTMREKLSHAVGEASGALGDLGTLLPYVVAGIGAGVLAPTPVFAGFALGYFLVALVFRMPMAVQPMKALGAMIIAGGLSSAEVAWSGAAIGGALLLLSLTPHLQRAARAIPQSVVTGLQAGLGLMLGLAAAELMAGDWRVAAASLAVLSLSLIWRRGPWTILVVLAGAIGGSHLGEPSLTASAPPADRALNTLSILSAIAGQLPLTLLNAVVIAAAVARSLYPDGAAVVSERRLAATSGALNLIMAPLGAMPMCHGAGGVSAHHFFGARGLGAPLILAALFGAAAFTGPSLVTVLTAIPSPVIGALLIFASFSLIATPRVFDARPDCRPVIAVAAFATLATGALGGLIAGIAAEKIRVYVRKRRGPLQTDA